MAEETITIFKVGTDEAVRNIHDLRNNIQILKEQIDDENLSWEEQNKKIAELQTNQAALRNAMHGTTSSLQDVSKAAQGAGTSYNALVKKMADLTQEFRATEDAVHRANLAREIKDINEQLKDLDAVRGIYGRNVGDYFNKITKPLMGVKDALHVIGKEPVMGMVMLLAPVITKIVDALKENETALAAVDKLLKALEPVMKFFEGILEKIAGAVEDVIDWVLELAADSGVSFKQIVSAATGVGNAILQFLLTPIRQTVDAVKGLGKVIKDVFSGNWKQAVEDAKEAGNNIAENFKKGFSFKANFQAGQEAGEEFLSGLKSKKKAANDAGKAIGEEVKKGFLSAADIDKLIAEAERREEKLRQDRLKMQKETDELAAQLEAEQLAEINAMLDEFQAEEDRRFQEEKDRQEMRVKLFQAYTSTVSSVFSSIADIYDNLGEEDEKAAAKSKGLRTAAAIIDTLSGAVSAFMSTWKSELPLSSKMILAPLNAASVAAAGFAQIQKINAVNVGSGGSATSVPAVVSAPSYTPAIQQTRSLTGRSEEDRLDRMASPSRVYILQSDIEAKLNQGRVKVVETSW